MSSIDRKLKETIKNITKENQKEMKLDKEFSEIIISWLEQLSSGGLGDEEMRKQMISRMTELMEVKEK